MSKQVREDVVLFVLTILLYLAIGAAIGRSVMTGSMVGGLLSGLLMAFVNRSLAPLYDADVARMKREQGKS